MAIMDVAFLQGILDHINASVEKHGTERIRRAKKSEIDSTGKIYQIDTNERWN